MAHQAFAGLLVVCRNAVLLHPGKNAVQNLLVLLHAEITVPVFHDLMRSSRIKSGNQFPVFILSDRELCFVSIPERRLHPHNRLHRNFRHPTDPLEVLSKTWSSLPEEDKFPAAGGDNGSPVDDKPGKFDISDTDNLDYMLSFPAGSVDLIDSAASISHMMNMNTFTCGAYHVKNAADAKTLAQALRDSIQSRQWMCGFPDKLVVITINEVVVAMYGNEELINSFRDTLTASYPAAVIDFDEAIQ